MGMSLVEAGYVEFSIEPTRGQTLWLREQQAVGIQETCTQGCEPMDTDENIPNAGSETDVP